MEESSAFVSTAKLSSPHPDEMPVIGHEEPRKVKRRHHSDPSEKESQSLFTVGRGVEDLPDWGSFDGAAFLLESEEEEEPIDYTACGQQLQPFLSENEERKGVMEFLRPREIEDVGAEHRNMQYLWQPLPSPDDHTINIGGNGMGYASSGMLQNSTGHINDIEDRVKEGGSSHKIWILLIVNVVIEITSAVLDQLASVKKPGCALAAMIMALVGLLGYVMELAYRGGKEKAEWRWEKGMRGFYCPTDSPPVYRRFGSLADVVGSVCAILQTTTSIVAYVYYSRHSDNPIKMSFWPIVSAIGLLCSQFLKAPNPKGPEHRD